MKVSTKGRYGLRAMFELAQQYGSGPIPLAEIAERQELSEQYLEQLIAILRKSGLIKSVQGAQGGYMLAKPPKEITVGDVLRVLEGPLVPVDCVDENVGGQDCRRYEQCVSRLVWEKVRDSVSKVVDSITLEDMCHDAKAMQRIIT